MAELVNGTHRERLASRDSEPTHLGGQDYDVIGGTGTDDAPNSVKIDAARGLKKDTSIPSSVGPEGSDLKKVDEDVDDEDDLDVQFGEDDEVDVDDLDKQLDELDSLDDVDVDLDLKEDDEDDDDKEDKIEESRGRGRRKAIKEDDENPFAKKDDDDKDDKKVDEDDDSKEDDEKIDEDENPFAKKDDDDEDKDEVKSESLKLRIKMPDTKLFESVGLGGRTQKKVAAIFESAIRSTTKQVATQVRAHYKKLHESKIVKRDAAMAKQMDSYLSYVVEEWVKSNRVSIRQSLRTQLSEEFLNRLQRLFKEHYIDVPESKVDVVAKLTEQNAKLKRSLNEQHGSALKLRKLAERANKARIVAEFARPLSEASAAKLQKLAEDTQYVNAKDFREKLGMLKESYFPAETPKKKTSHLPAENLQEQVAPGKKKVSEHPEVDAVVAALGSGKSSW